MESHNKECSADPFEKPSPHEANSTAKKELPNDMLIEVNDYNGHYGDRIRDAVWGENMIWVALRRSVCWCW
jgi:hypothetical protein